MSAEHKADKARTQRIGARATASRKEVDAVLCELDEKLKPLTDAIRDSERLSEEDFAIRINARD